MKVYKVVPCPGRVVVKSKENMSGSFDAFADIVSQESLGGWELVAAMPLTVVKKKRRLRTFEEPYNALVFAKEADSAPTEEN